MACPRGPGRETRNRGAIKEYLDLTKDSDLEVINGTKPRSPLVPYSDLRQTSHNDRVEYRQREHRRRFETDCQRELGDRWRRER